MEQHQHRTLKRTYTRAWNCVTVITVCLLLFQTSFRVSGQVPEQRSFTVVIDAGHGGKDPGAVGKNSHEKNIALAIAKKTGHYIENLMPDVQVIYTRKTDVFVDLDVRADIANKAQADLFMSIHVDGIGTPNAYGTSTYVMGATKNENNLALAMKENKVIELEEDYSEKYESFDPNDLSSFIAMNLMQGTYEKHSLNMASKVQDQFRTRAKRRDRGVHSAPFIVLWKTTMPSVLIETGFITNPKEEQFLNTDYGQDLVASAIYRAFRDYKEDIENRTATGTSLASVPAEEASGQQGLDLKALLDQSQQVSTSTAEKATVKEEGNLSITTALAYRVQIMASKNQVPLDHHSFKQVRNLEELREGEYYKYTSRPVATYTEASKIHQELSRNFSGAFIVAYHNGVKIPVQQARELEKK